MPLSTKKSQIVVGYPTKTCLYAIWYISIARRRIRHTSMHCSLNVHLVSWSSAFFAALIYFMRLCVALLHTKLRRSGWWVMASCKKALRMFFVEAPAARPRVCRCGLRRLLMTMASHMFSVRWLAWRARIHSKSAVASTSATLSMGRAELSECAHT